MMDSYRESHTGRDRGLVYDVEYDRPVNRVYWENFERPILERIFSDLSDAGCTRYLDLACGTGRVTGVGAVHFLKSMGIDLSEDMLARAKAKHPEVRFLRGDVTKGEIEVEPFDVISMFRLLLNAEDELRLAMLRWCRANIKAEGTLVINNHLAKRSFQGLWLKAKSLSGGETPKFLGEAHLKRLLAESGFRVIAAYGFRLLPDSRGRLLIRSDHLVAIENAVSKFPGITRALGRDQIYLCKPV